MRTSAIFALALMAASTNIANADSYIGASYGVKAPLAGSVGDQFSTADARNARLILGQRIGNIALEGSLFGTELFRGQEKNHTLSLGLDLKYHFPLLLALGAYGKVGVHRTWLQADDDILDSYSGNSYALGGGLDFTFTVDTLFVDYTHQNLNLKSDRSSVVLGGNANLFSAGLTLHF